MTEKHTTTTSSRPGWMSKTAAFASYRACSPNGLHRGEIGGGTGAGLLGDQDICRRWQLLGWYIRQCVRSNVDLPRARQRHRPGPVRPQVPDPGFQCPISRHGKLLQLGSGRHMENTLLRSICPEAPTRRHVLGWQVLELQT